MNYSQKSSRKHKNTLKILICGNYGATNLGDEAILDGILQLVRRVRPDTEITVLSADPEETRKMHNVNSARLMPAGPRSLMKGLFDGSIRETINKIKECDAFLLGGGGLFTDEKFRAIIIWSIQAKFAYFYKKPVFCIGQSVGPLRTFLGKRITKKVFKKARFITLRDSGSQKLLDKIGVPLCPVLADPSFALPGLHVTSNLPENYVVFSIRSWIENYKLLYKYCAHFIDFLWDRYKIKTILVPFQTVIDDDDKILNNIFVQIKLKESAQIFEYTSDYRKVIELISRSKAVIGMRLHSLIFSTLVHRPFLALSYSDKVTQFINDLELSDYCINLKDVDFETLKDRFVKLIENTEYIEKKLSEKHFLFTKKAHEHEAILDEFFKTI